MVGDTTAIETRQGFLYLALLTDLCTRAIVGWAMSEHNDTNLVLEAFRMARKRGFTKGFIHHSDRGSTYACVDYRKAVELSGSSASELGELARLGELASVIVRGRGEHPLEWVEPDQRRAAHSGTRQDTSAHRRETFSP